VKLPIDMNLSPAWVDFLGLTGIEAAHLTTSAFI
jgi:predicted nuclease of predicted toxin-antitoxin system